MPQALFYLFVYFLLTIPVFLGLALVAQLGRSAAARRAGELVLITGIAALVPVVLHRALEVPALWLAVALLVAVLVVSVVMHVRSYSRSA
ncbi:hypothetical protein ACFOW4_23350 [Micromonospora sp. GCM10011542]|uniref:hypothetical protein n=1 Tax=Micromonospora sp. GCM10011542 TaxID=3317337 RepID=UPI0036138F1D